MATQESTLAAAARLMTPIPLTEDVLQMARDARKDQGIHEQEVSFSGEAGLHDSLNSCEKNPGHDGFTPITEMCAERLPEVIRCPAVSDFLVSKARETVRLSCTYTSPARPDNYCFSSYRGRRDMTRYGSGRVWSVFAERLRYDIPCPFTDCTEQRGVETCKDEPAEEIENERLQSAKDVKVNKDNESRGLEDRKPGQETCKEEGKDEIAKDTQPNHAKERSITERDEIVEKSVSQFYHRSETRKERGSGKETSHEECGNNSCSDNVRVEKERQEMKHGDQKSLGENKTVMLNVSNKNIREKVSEYKSSSDCINRNAVCTSGFNNVGTTEVRKPNSETGAAKNNHKNAARTDESDLNQVDSHELKTHIVQELVQAVDKEKDTTSPAPPKGGERANNEEKPRSTFETNLKNATFSEIPHQPAPPQHYVSGFFRIHTAKHVIFDDAEAQQTIVEFFYDDHRDVRHVIRARGVRVTRSDLDGDYCVLDCVTHDRRLGAALDAVRREWMGMWNGVKDIIYGSDVSMVVSHPHGCSKQFSIGRCLSREWGEAAGGQGWYRYTYDAPTCPGTSGAPVWVPGRDGLISGYAPHSGCFSADVARSAVWFFWNMQNNL